MKKIFCKYSILFLASTVPLFSMMSDQNQGGDKVIVASPAYDFTFKRLFNKSEHLINFLNSLFYPNAKENDLKIREITYNPEASIPGEKYKHIYFDISCTCTAYAITSTRAGHGPSEVFKFDVEMQRKGLEEYYKRSVFYGARLFSQDTPKAISYSDITPIKVVSFLRESFYSPCGEVLYKVTPMIVCQKPNEGTVYELPSQPTMEWFYIQLDKITAECSLESPLEQWINFMDLERYGEATAKERYAYTIERDKFTDAGVRAAIDEMAEIASKDFIEYKKSVDAERADAMLEAGKQESLTKARAEAKAEKARADAEKARADELAQKLARLEEELQKVTVQTEGQ